MKLRIKYQDEMYDVEVLGDYRVVIKDYNTSFYQQEGDAKINLTLDQCRHCGEWKSEDEELYGEGFCSKCSAMCFECEGYFNYVDMIPPDIEAGQEEPVCKECNLKMAKKLWAEFGDVPIDENEDIDTDWREFLKGTNKFTIWHWFEREYNVSIAKDLQCT